MGKIDLKGLKGLKGSALAGLKGMYTPEGYTSYIEANQSAISKKKMQNPWKNDIDIADNMYVTKLIKDDIGEDEYDKQGIWSMSVAEKVDYYNNRYSQTKNPLDAAEVAMTTPVQKDSTANTLAYDGSISMKEYNEKINNEISLLPDDYPIFLLDPKEDNTRVTMSDILKRKSETQENGEQYTFKKKGRSELGPTTKQAEYERSSYAKEYRKAMDSSYQTASDMYENFYKEITETDSDSAKFLKHADFYNLPLTVDGIKDIMADYYATKDLYGPEIAQQSTLTALQNYASESQGWFSGANSRFGNIAPGFTSAIISSFVNIGSFLINGPAAIALAASGDEPLEETKDIISKHEFYQKLANDPGAYENFKKMSFKDRLDFLMGNSELSRNANAIAKTGELNKEKRQYMIEEGLSNIENIRKPGEETEIWNWNTLFDLLPQAGYTVAAMYTGGGIAKGLTWISKLAGLRRASKALQAANKLKLAKAAMSIDDIVIMGLSAVPSAAAEATMDAQDVYDEIMEGSYAEMSSMLNKKFEAEIDDRNSDLWKYIEEEMSKQPIPLSTEGQHLTDEDYAKIQREKVQSLMEKYYNDNYQSLLDSPEFNREVTGAAMRASANTMGAETMYIAAGTLLLQNTLGRGVKALKGDLVRRINPAASGRFALTTENGTIRVGVRGSANSKARAVAKGISQGITESAEEGFEELYQGVTSDVNTGLAYDYLERYLNARYNGESTEELATSLWQNLDVAQKLIGESMFSEENVFAFAMGAMGAALGSPTALRGGVQLARMSKEERKSLSKKEIANMLWRNPFSENIHDNLNEIQHLQTEAEYYNKLIENQTIDVKALGDVNGIISWINEEAKALMNNDEVGARDARASQTMQTLLLMDKLKGTAYANAFKRELEAMSKMDVNNLNEGSKTILDKARTIRQDTTSQDAEILQDIKDRAKKTLNMMEQIDYWSANIEGEFGNAIDPEVKNGIITNHVMMSEWERRVDDINKYVAEQINRGKKVPLSFEGASDTQNTSAKHGSIEHIKDQIAKIDKTIELLERSTPKKERGAIYKSRIRQLQALKKELQSDSKLLTENSSTLIKAEDILSLDPEARAALLDEKNLNNYSQEQQDEIAKFKKDPNVTSEILKDIQDASTIQKKIKHSKEELHMLESDKKFLSKYAFEVKTEVAKRNLKTKLKSALEAKTYEEFEKAVDEYLAKGDPSVYEQQMLDSVLRESKYYQKYSEHNDNLIDTVHIFNDSPEYQALDDNKKALANLMIKRAMLTNSETEFGPDKVLSLLTDNEFLEYAKKEGVDTAFLSTDERDAFASVLSNIFNQVEQYNKNQVALAQKAKEKINGNKDSSLYLQGQEHEENKTIFDKKRYANEKERFDALFTRVAEYFNNRKHTVLTKQEFVEFLSLLIDEDIDSAKITDIETSFNREDLSETLNEIDKWLTNKEYSAEVENDVEYQEMKKLRRAIDRVLTNANTSKNVSRFLENAIKEVNGDFRSVFDTKQKVKKLPKLEKVGIFSSKRFKRLSTKTESQWYLDNHIKENNEKVAELFNGTTALDATVVLVNDVNLTNNLQAEIGELTDDNTPLIMAVRVPVGTEGAVTIEGQPYLYIGLLQNSRLAGANRNTLNDIRSVIIANGNPNGIVKTRFGKIYESKGVRIKRAVVDNEEIGIRDFYIGENGRFAKEWQEADTPEKKAIVKDKIEADFKNHFVKIHLSQDLEHKTENGEYVTEATYVAPGETKARHYTYTTPNAYNTYVTIGWVDEKTPDKVYTFNVATTAQTEVDEDGTSLFDALTETDMQDTQYAYSDANIVRKAIKSIITDLTDPANLRRLMNAETAKSLSFELTKHVNKHINLLMRYSQRNDGVGDLVLNVETNGDTAFIHLIDRYSGTPIKMYPNKSDMEQAILKVPLNYLTDKSKSSELWNAVQLAVRDVLFTENGEIRTDNNGIPLAKLQVDYGTIMSKRKEDEKYAKYLIFTNLLRMKQTHTGELSVETNETQQAAPSTGDAVLDAAKALDGNVKGNPENKKLDGAIGVTTFIVYEDDAVTEYTGYNRERVSKVATSLGTSIDRLIRTFLNGKQSVEDVIEYAKNAQDPSKPLYTWPGFGKIEKTNTELVSFLSQVKDLADMLAAKGETILPAEYMFSTEVQAGNRYARLTAEPDLITVDKNGNYHIYDFKSFYGQGQTIAVVKGKVNSEFRIVGLKDANKHIEQWQKQLSLYKLAIETKVGAGKVVELGVIPIRLGYDKANAFTSEDKYPTLNTNRVFDKKGDGTTKDRALKLNFNNNAIDGKPQTRMFKDIISVDAVDPLSISSDKWSTRTFTQQEEQSQQLQDIVSGKKKEDVSTDTVETNNQQVEQTSKPITIDNVETAPEVERTDTDAALDALRDIFGSDNITSLDETGQQRNEDISNIEC